MLDRRIGADTLRFAVLGESLSHTWSPYIHNSLFLCFFFFFCPPETSISLFSFFCFFFAIPFSFLCFHTIKPLNDAEHDNGGKHTASAITD